jgi:hypothetical protein
MIVRAVLAILLALVVAGCGSEKQQAGGTTSECQPLAGGGTTSRSGPGPAETMYLTNVTVETLDCADRVVFDFGKDQPQTPGYLVAYQPGSTAKIEDGSGNSIEIAGSAFLVVKLQPAATAEITGEKLKLTYTGPRRFTPGGSRHVSEVVKTGDFEAVVTWVIGLDDQRPFAAKSTDSQLIVDIG